MELLQELVEPERLNHTIRHRPTFQPQRSSERPHVAASTTKRRDCSKEHAVARGGPTCVRVTTASWWKG
jgi:hypothetical protein